MLVLERETAFKDRVRGEGMTSWGCGEARELGIYDLLKSSCGHELPIWEDAVDPDSLGNTEEGESDAIP